MEPNDGVILLLIFLLSSIWIGAPVAYRLTHRSLLRPQFEPGSEDSFPQASARKIADLEALGFVVLGRWGYAGHSHATAQVILAEHPQNFDVAKLVVVVASTRREETLLFQTRFEDGSDIVTANNRTPTGMPRLPESTVLWLPELRGARSLFRAHERMRNSLGSDKKRLPLGNDAVGYLIEGAKRMHVHFVETGYFYSDEPHGVLRPTWKGAMLMTWKLLWPVKPLFRAWRRRQTRNLLREFGVHLDQD
jgi:hypothetical protein